MKNLFISFLATSLFFVVSTKAQTKDVLRDPRDNKVYKIIKIGEQVWMAQNLNFETENSWCYNKDTAYCRLYGRLYTYEISSNACPAGWHVPSDQEWSALTDFLGGEDIAGLKMQGVDPNDNSNPVSSKINSSGFSGIAGGNRSNKAEFGLVGKYGCWWSSTEYNKTNAWSRYLTYTTAHFYSHFDNKNCAFSIRCVKN